MPPGRCRRTSPISSCGASTRSAPDSLTQAIAEAQKAGYIGERVLGSPWSISVRMHLSAGRYMCGEESGLLNALEGRRATPRNKPPFPQVSGLWGRPTVVNNVETLVNVPHIIREGADWYKALSPGSDPGTKIFGVSGKLKRPGPVGAAHGHHRPASSSTLPAG